MKKQIIVFIFFCCCIIEPIHSQTFANDEGEETSVNEPPPPNGNPNEPVPIDGGLSVLVAAAIGYGAKKRYDFKKKQIKENNKD